MTWTNGHFITLTNLFLNFAIKLLMCCQTFSCFRQLDPRISTLNCIGPVGLGLRPPWSQWAQLISLTHRLLSCASLLSWAEAGLEEAGSRLALSISTLSSSLSSRGERWAVAILRVRAVSDPEQRIVICYVSSRLYLIVANIIS